MVLICVPPKTGKLGFDGVAEVRDQRCGLFVSVCLGQRGEAGDVGKHERRGGRVGSWVTRWS